jgi:hypothetical protein
MGGAVMSTPVRSGLTAVDVLLEPDAAARKRAAALNARLRADQPTSFAFDATHRPHVTLLQRYVRTEDLQRVVAALERVAAAADAGALAMHAAGISSGELGTPAGTKLVSVEFERAPAVRALHEAAIAALAPFAQTSGDSRAFFAEPDEAPANAATVAYVEQFVPEHSGEHYAPHMSLGVAGAALVADLEHAPAQELELRPEAFAVYQIGDLGTARRVLRRWPLRSAA